MSKIYLEFCRTVFLAFLGLILHNSNLSIRCNVCLYSFPYYCLLLYSKGVVVRNEVEENEGSAKSNFAKNKEKNNIDLSDQCQNTIRHWFANLMLTNWLYQILNYNTIQNNCISYKQNNIDPNDQCRKTIRHWFANLMLTN